MSDGKTIVYLVTLVIVVLYGVEFIGFEMSVLLMLQMIALGSHHNGAD